MQHPRPLVGVFAFACALASSVAFGACGPSTPAKGPTASTSASASASEASSTSIATQISASDVVETDGLRLEVRAAARRISGGFGVDLSILVTSSDDQEHVLRGTRSGLTLVGRVNDETGGSGFGEGGGLAPEKVPAGGSVTLARKWDHDPVKPGSTLELTVTSWHSLGSAPKSSLDLPVAVVTLEVPKTGAPTLSVKAGKAKGH